MIYLESQYFPNIAWMQLFIKADDVSIEKFDFYQKQSLCNRCHIIGAQKPMMLSVPLLGGRNQKIILKDVKIDNAQRWQQHHCKAIQSCYGKAPFFENYVDKVVELILKPTVFLIDLNLSIIQQSASWLKWKGSLHTTSLYLPSNALPPLTIDQRNSTRTKTDNPPYTQVFFDRKPFHPGLSFLDALFCLGPTLNKYLIG